MSQTLLKFPFQRIVSIPVTFKSTVELPELSTRFPNTRGGSDAKDKPPKPAPAMLPEYWIKGNCQIDKGPPETFILFEPSVVNDPTPRGAPEGLPSRLKSTEPPVDEPSVKIARPLTTL